VVIDAQGWIVNRQATEQRRARIRARRGWREVPKVQWTDPVVDREPGSAQPMAEMVLSK
jgi:hypothetical protein